MSIEGGKEGDATDGTRALTVRPDSRATPMVAKVRDAYNVEYPTVYPRTNGYYGY